MSILICSTTYGGCGFIGNGQLEFKGDADYVECPQCGEDHAFQLTRENYRDLTHKNNRDLAWLLLTCDPTVVGKARCGCDMQIGADEPCEHDIALARERITA